LDWIELSSFRVNCILGVLEREQREPQDLDIDVRLSLSLEDAGERDDLEASVDYAAVMESFTVIAEEGRWRLLESMALAMARLVLAPPAPGEGRAQVEAVEIRLRKPDILAPRATPGIGLVRERAWCRMPRVPVAPGVVVEILQENHRNGAYRVHLEAGARWAVPSQLALQGLAGEAVLDRPLHRLERDARREGRILRAESPLCLLAVGFPAWRV